MYTTPPSWSMPAKYPQPKPKEGPSPCGYNPSIWEPLHSPSWKIGKEKRNKQNHYIAPGPGYYESNVTRKSRQYGKFNRENYRRQNPSQNPSPQHYSPNYDCNHPSSPELTICGKSRELKSNEVPGPGFYQTPLTTKKSQVSVKIGDSKRFPAQKTNGPGPQTYNPAKNFKKISVGFAKGSKPARESTTPGPGSYVSKDLFDTSIFYKRGYSISSKHKPAPEDLIPGPGDYSPNFVSQPQSPKVSMKGCHEPFKPVKTPSPSQYNIAEIIKTSTGYSIGRAERKSQEVIVGNPGPGAYNPMSVHHATPKLEEYKTISPGPGTYNADRNSIKRRPQSAKIGKSLRSQNERENIPGPGSYQLMQPRLSTPCRSFTREERGQRSLEKSPGPGSYHIQSILGQCPSYSYSTKHR